MRYASSLVAGMRARPRPALRHFYMYAERTPRTRAGSRCGTTPGTIALLGLLCLALLAAPACRSRAAAAPTPAAGTEAAQPPQTSPAIPLAQVAAEADTTLATVRKLASDRRSREEVEAAEAELPVIEREVEARARESVAILAQRPSLDLLRDMESRWQDARSSLDTRSERLSDAITRLDRDLATLEKLADTWSATLSSVKAERAPPEVLRLAESVLAEIAAARKALLTQRTAALRAQARVSDLQSSVSEALQANRAVRDAGVDEMFSRDSAPLWNPKWRVDAAQRIAAGAVDAFQRQWTLLEIYLQPRTAHMALQAALLVALSLLIFLGRRRLVALVEQEPDLRQVATVVERPVASALILTLIATPWIYPQPPRLLWAIAGVAMLVPSVIVLRRLVAPYLRAPLYATIGFFFVDQARAVSASIAIVPRLLSLGEMIAAVLFLLWFARRRRLEACGLPSQGSISTVRAASGLALALCAVAALANAAGFVALSNLIGSVVLDSLYAGLVLYTIVRILDALVVILMRMRPLAALTMVRTHRQLLRSRARRVLQWLAAFIWAAYVLDRLAIRDRVVDGVQAMLDATLTLGEMRITLSSVLSFVLAIWAAFLVSRLVRFVLNEEVFPRASLKRGVPYAISRTIHFLIIALGFFVAMGVIGMEMTQFTILASAFTIGVGFGLQNIFNNFVSGLIVLFERPVQVGDVIQIDDSIGVVDRIGVRATVVRTQSRSEVIVPNGKLISDRVVNWTLSNRQRVIELPISVVLQSEPEKVIAILERVGREHRSVLGDPPPRAIITRLGPDWMGFELRVAIAEVEGWMTVRSELAVAAVRALRAAEVALR